MEKRTKIRTKELNAKVIPYILDAIHSEEKQFSNDQERLQYLAETFMSEYCWAANLRLYGSYQEVMRNWIMGLPSAFNIDFENYRIIEIAKEWGSIPKDADDRMEDKILDNWFNLIAAKTMQLFSKYKIQLHTKD